MAQHRQHIDLDGHGAPPEDFSEKIHLIWQYWQDKRDSKALPDRADIDPVLDLPAILPGIWLLDVVGDEPRFRYRLVGEHIRNAGKMNLVGHYLDDLPEVGKINRAIDGLKVAAADQIPYWRRGTPHLLHSRYVSGLEFIGLPLTHGEDRTTRMMMNLTVFSWQEN